MQRMFKMYTIAYSWTISRQVFGANGHDVNIVEINQVQAEKKIHPMRCVSK